MFYSDIRYNGINENNGINDGSSKTDSFCHPV